MRMLRHAAALAAAIALPLPAAATTATVDADPAIWVVRDSDTTIYLFGTFHVLDGKAEWFNDEVRKAFDSADEVVLEALGTDDPEAHRPMVQRYALDRSGKPLSAKLSPEARTRLAELLKSAGAPPQALDPFKPAFAGMNVAMIAIQKAGFAGAHGPEKRLSEAARKSGKALGEIEGVEAQLQMLDRIPEAAQLHALEDSLRDLDSLPAKIAKLRDGWNSGDADTVASIMREMQGKSPDTYRVMMVERNARWAGWIQDRLTRPGTVFLAVGAGHLAGPDSVQKRLSAKGIATARYTGR